MDSVISENLKKLASLIFDKSGLSRCVPLIQDEVELQLKESHTRINKDEDEDEEDLISTPCYGGVVYHHFKAVNDSKFCPQLDTELSNSEKKLIERLILNKCLDISVVRTDLTGQNWSFKLLIPFILNKQDSDAFELKFKINVTGYLPPYTIEAYSKSEITEDQISKTLIMYSLQI
jgi:hypothetical protein